MTNAEKAKRAREIATQTDPEVVRCIDLVRSTFGARLTYLRVAGCGDAVEIGDGKDFERTEAIAPAARYLRPEEAEAEWERIKEAVWSRDSARKRASGRRAA